MSFKIKILLAALLAVGVLGLTASRFSVLSQEQTGGGSFSIKGELTGTEGEYIYIYEFYGTEIFPVDSTLHSGGKFAFERKRKKPFPRGFYKIGSSVEKSVLLILSQESVVLKADLSNPKDFTITGSKENDKYNSFTELNASLSAYYEQINKTAGTYSSLRESNPEEYTTRINSLQKKLDSAVQVTNDKHRQLKESAEGLFAGKFMNMFSFTDATPKAEFFSKADFSDPELARGDMLPTKISIYMQRYVKQDIEIWKQEAENILNLAPLGTAGREIVYQVVIRNLYSMDGAYARILCEKYVAEYPKSRLAKNLYDAIPKLPPVVGEDAREIELQTPDGQLLALSSLKGKVVLLDFWASWCGPCRKENPNVVRAYNKYKDRGFTVFSVSLDNDKGRWLKAIQADSLTWSNHVSDLKGWQSSVVRQYGVKGIPTTYLLGPDGKVVAVNPRGPALEQKLAEIFK